MNLLKRMGVFIICVAGAWSVPQSGASQPLPYSKPDVMMNIPTSSKMRTPYLFRAGFVGNIYKFAPGFESAKGLYIDTQLAHAFSIGFSSAKGVAVDDPVQYAFHFKKRVFQYEDISIAAGLYNMIFQSNPATNTLNLRKYDMSFFGVIANEKQGEDFTLTTYMGFGTGLLAGDFQSSDTTNNAGVFAGFRLNSSMLRESGGVDFIGEYDGSGLNIGARIPLNKNYRLNLGILRIDNLPKFGTPSAKRPSFVLGMDMTIPRFTDYGKKAPSGFLGADNDLAVMQRHYETKIDSIIRAKNLEISGLQDSLRITLSQIDRLRNEVAMLRQQTAVLKDSVQRVKLERHVYEQNINLALKHLSRSLRYFYAGNYREALQEVDIAIELNDNLALAYARRGSIYYKLGDIDRATINWNLALQIDPEYDDVRNILRALSENRLRTTSTITKK